MLRRETKSVSFDLTASDKVEDLKRCMRDQASLGMLGNSEEDPLRKAGEKIIAKM